MSSALIAGSEQRSRNLPSSLASAATAALSSRSSPAPVVRRERRRCGRGASWAAGSALAFAEGARVGDELGELVDHHLAQRGVAVGGLGVENEGDLVFASELAT